MKYEEKYCYWCKKNTENKEVTYSIGTDTLQTRRNFCNHDCFQAFKTYFKYQGMGDFAKKPVVPYKGK